MNTIALGVFSQVSKPREKKTDCSRRRHKPKRKKKKKTVTRVKGERFMKEKI